MMRIAIATGIVLGLLASVCGAAAQEAAPDEEIRHEAQEILADPEFRYFEHLGDSAERPAVRGMRPHSGFGSGAGADGQSDERESGTERTGPRGAARGTRNRTGRPRDSNSSSSESRNGDSTVSIPRGSLGAVGQAFGFLFHALAYLVLIAVCGLIVYLVVQAILSRELKSETHLSPLLNLDVPQEEDHPPGELPADAYLAHARELALQGRYREAIAQLLLGSMSSIERAELIRHRRGLTLRDYLRSLRGKEPHYDGFQAMIRLYEPVAFGRRIASHQTFQDALSGYERAILLPAGRV
jgi:hypothetical protein